MIALSRVAPYYPKDDRPLFSFILPHEEMVKRFGPPHRLMDQRDNEPGPCEYWAYRLSESLSVLITYHLHSPGGASGVVSATEPDIERIIRELEVSDVVNWRLDKAHPDIFKERCTAKKT